MYLNHTAASYFVPEGPGSSVTSFGSIFSQSEVNHKKQYIQVFNIMSPQIFVVCFELNVLLYLINL